LCGDSSPQRRTIKISRAKLSSVDRTGKLAAELVKLTVLPSGRADPRPVADSGNEFSMPVALPTTVDLGTPFQFNLTHAIAGLNCPEPGDGTAAATDAEGGGTMKQPPCAQDQ
jgi:hypothetical protein